MSFKEWLPITARNRVALGYAFLGQIVFVIWNITPVFTESSLEASKRYAFLELWPKALSSEPYVSFFRDITVATSIYLAICLAFLLNGFVTITMVPFWGAIHASSFVRWPLRILTFLGVIVASFFACYIISVNGSYDSASWIWTLISFNMFVNAAALFTFRNELALREERNRPVVE